jgi:hypothetical protein
VGHDTYGDFCVFSNIVKLDKFQVKFLRDKVSKIEPTRPFYVCTMKRSNIRDKTKAKMVNMTTLNKFLF